MILSLFHKNISLFYVFSFEHKESSVGDIADEVQSTPHFSLTLHFLTTTLIYTGVSFTGKSREEICSQGAYKELLYMKLHAQIKWLHQIFPEADTNLH